MFRNIFDTFTAGEPINKSAASIGLLVESTAISVTVGPVSPDVTGAKPSTTCADAKLD